MSPRLAAAAAVLAIPLVLVGCTGDEGTAPESALPSGGSVAGVDVDTPQLRAQREAAGIPACRQSVGGASPPVAGGLPEVTLPCLGGGPGVDLAALRGPLVVNLWAQWCDPCREELPYFARLHRSGVDVLGVDFQDAQPGAALALAERAGVTYPSVADVDGVLEAPLRVPGMPTTALLDGDGRVAAVLPQQFTSYDQLVDAVDEHLGVRP